MTAWSVRRASDNILIDVPEGGLSEEAAQMLARDILMVLGRQVRLNEPYYVPDPDDRHLREDAVQVVSQALNRLGCVVPLDPMDPDDVVSVASEAVRALIVTGMLPTEAPEPYQCSQEPHPGVEFYGEGGCAECGYRPSVAASATS